MPLSCQQLLQKYPDLWRDATVHPFLTQCQTGEIQPHQFNTWLVQDYLFVTEFTRLAGALVTWAPIDHFDVLLGGMTALKDELNWFREKATERQLTLDVPHQPTCQIYCAFMVNMATAPYAVMATAFWAIELAYNQGWQLPGKMPEPYTEFADRWGNPGFTEYVKLLEAQADAMLQSASEEVLEQAEQAFIKVAQLERDFWQMAFAAD
ncbi:TenA family transcriptional regulator [Leptolyngbya ohadii]|uniref:TenA family transcriptional regulator n=1 Tax=Leptolyngbya ohadii TaxID=1962290 RepID=UPI000B59C95A|nr:TenA family transcriptional regulator [Leptolyngbya ohadii]